jgi:prolyl oligopeptidase PreP (S9A serine peptidase family)
MTLIEIISPESTYVKGGSRGRLLAGAAVISLPDHGDALEARLAKGE